MPPRTNRPPFARPPAFPLQVRKTKKAKEPLQEISAYEQLRQNNIDANNEKLASLNLSPLQKKKPTPAQQNLVRLAFEKKLVKEAHLHDAKDLATCITKRSVHVPVRCCSVLTLLL